MPTTRNSLPQKIRDQVIRDLAPLLADATDLTLQAKQAHWNVRGPSFIALHQLFDSVYGHAGEWADSIAERIAQLGGAVPGTLQAAHAATRLTVYPLDLTGEKPHVERVAAALAQFGESVRVAIDVFASIGDADTADLATEISREVDKDLWFVEAHLGG
jgi:starvation-inducible DNA-binding protein